MPFAGLAFVEAFVTDQLDGRCLIELVPQLLDRPIHDFADTADAADRFVNPQFNGSIDGKAEPDKRSDLLEYLNKS